jgi:DNA-binding transcriptional regulator YhcF (GntR family)
MSLSTSELMLDRSSDVPLGTQLAWKLRSAIVGERLRPLERLPGVREAAAAAGVNVNTVRAVYARLVQQGLIVSERGRGTFVGEHAAEHAELRALAERAATEARERGIDPRDVAQLLYAGASSTNTANETRTRRALRAQIAALDQELTELESEMPSTDPTPAPARAGAGPGARILTAGELEDVRDRLAAAVARRRADADHQRAREERPQRVPKSPRPTSSPWPELLASKPRLHSG